MSYKNRSKEYDWFKNGTPAGDPKQSKWKAFKTSWKFTRIFLMFSLFFFSMYGCVQSFVIKNDTKVGLGLELYNDERDIAPHVEQFKIEKAGKAANDIYTLKATGTNVWLNPKASDQEAKTLTGVQDQLIKDGTTENKHKLSDAFKGLNQAVQVIDSDGSFVGGEAILKSNNGKYFAISTFSENAQVDTATGLTNIIASNKGKNDGESFHVNIPGTTTPQQKARLDWMQTLYERLDKVMTDKYKTSKWAYTGSHFLTSSLTDTEFNFAASNLPTGFTKDQTFNTIKQVQRETNDLLLSFIGATVDHDAKQITFNKNWITNTTYRPIVSWAQAWTRGVGPFYGLFVFPVSRLANSITNGLPLISGFESLLAIVFIVFILRAIALALTFKSKLQQTKQQELGAKKAIIDAKYAGYKGNKQMEMRQRQEVAELYKKEGVSPLGALGSAFIAMPIFLSIWRVVGSAPHLKSTVWLGINFSATSWKELMHGGWQYLPLIILAGASAAFSQYFPRLLTKRRDKNRINVHQKEAMKKSNKQQNIMMIVFVIMSLIFNAAIQIYWIVGAIWTTLESTLTHHFLVWDKNRRRRNKIK